MKIEQGTIKKIILVSFCFILYFTWSLAEPFQSCPDERMRYGVVNYIFETNSLPVEGDPLLRDEIYGFSYATSPPLPYILAAVFMKIASVFSSSQIVLLMASRMVSILAGVGFVILSIKIAERLFSNKTGKWCFIFLCAFWPQVVFLFTYFNCDALALFLVALVFYFLVKGTQSGWGTSTCVGLSIGIALCVLTYYNTLGIIVCSIFVFYISHYMRGTPFKAVISKTLLIIGIVMLLAGWNFIRNAILYHGDFLGLSITRALGEAFAQSGFTPSERGIKSAAQMTSIPGLLYWFVLSAKSFIGFFGQMDIPLKTWMYNIYLFIILISIIGFCCFIRQWIKGKKPQSERIILGIGMFICASITFALSVYYSFSDFQPQGRYLMPGFLSVVWFLSVGLEQINEYTKRIKIQAAPVVAILTITVIISCYFQLIAAIY